MKNQTDLRIIKTERNIREGFFKLLRQKPVEKITIREICETACCSRNTFYAHYIDKDALYNQIVDECIRAIGGAFDPVIKHASEVDDYVVELHLSRLLAAIDSAKDTLRTLLSQGDVNVFYSRLTGALYQRLIRNGKRLSPTADANKGYQDSCMFMAAGVAGCVVFWMRADSFDVDSAKAFLRPLMTSSFLYSAKCLEP